jgi:hypothetical protein
MRHVPPPPLPLGYRPGTAAAAAVPPPPPAPGVCSGCRAVASAAAAAAAARSAGGHQRRPKVSAGRWDRPGSSAHKTWRPGCPAILPPHPPQRPQLPRRRRRHLPPVRRRDPQGRAQLVEPGLCVLLAIPSAAEDEAEGDVRARLEREGGGRRTVPDVLERRSVCRRRRRRWC